MNQTMYSVPEGSISKRSMRMRVDIYEFSLFTQPYNTVYFLQFVQPSNKKLLELKINYSGCVKCNIYMLFTGCEVRMRKTVPEVSNNGQ